MTANADLRDPKTASIKGKILLVDDEPEVLTAFERVLRRGGFEVETAAHGAFAIERFAANHYDAIVSDITMPGLGGIELLRAVRRRDLDVPILLITGGASIETAAQAVELGAFRYLLKPIEPIHLLAAVKKAVAVHKLARAKQDALAELQAASRPIGDLTGLEVRFVSALKALYMVYQPIVSWKDRRIYGYEALVRSREPALPHPGALLDAAERLGFLHELGRVIRDHIGKAMHELPPDTLMFVNLHSHDLADATLYDADALLTRNASRVVLEITERASLDDVKDVRACIARLREKGFRIAVDDLGAGYAGLTSFAQLEPHVVKLDMSLVRSINDEPIKQRLAQTLSGLCKDLEIQFVAEGVETVEERDALLDCGCDLLQGYLFAKPAAPFAQVTW